MSNLSCSMGATCQAWPAFPSRAPKFIHSIWLDPFCCLLLILLCFVCFCFSFDLFIPMILSAYLGLWNVHLVSFTSLQYQYVITMYCLIVIRHQYKTMVLQSGTNTRLFCTINKRLLIIVCEITNDVTTSDVLVQVSVYYVSHQFPSHKYQCYILDFLFLFDYFFFKYVTTIAFYYYS